MTDPDEPIVIELRGMVPAAMLGAVLWMVIVALVMAALP